MCLKNTIAGLGQGKQVAGEDYRRSAMLEEEERRWRACHAPSRTARVKQGKITVSTRVAHTLGFWPSDLVKVVGGSPRSSSGGRCHPMRP